MGYTCVDSVTGICIVALERTRSSPGIVPWVTLTNGGIIVETGTDEGEVMLGNTGGI